MQRRVVGYIRVSSIGQQDGLSLPEQGRLISEYCERMGLELVAIYKDAESGATTDRTSFKICQKLVFKDHVDGMVVWDFWRLSRSLRDSEIIRFGFEKRDKLLLSVQQNFDMSQNSGVMAFQMNQAMGELDRKNIHQRLDGLRKAKVDLGSWPGHGVPFGLRVSTYNHGRTKLKKLEPDPETFHLVEQIKQAAGTLRQIGERFGLSKDGVVKVRNRDYDQLLSAWTVPA